MGHRPIEVMVRKCHFRIITHDFPSTSNKYKCALSTFVLLVSLTMGASCTKKQKSSSSNSPSSTVSNPKYVQKVEENTSKDTSSSISERDSHSLFEISPATPKLGRGRTLKRSSTVKRKRVESLAPYPVNGGSNLSTDRDNGVTWNPSTEIFSLEPPIGSSWDNTSPAWPSTQDMCIWCGMRSCPSMCFATYRAFNPVSDGNSTSGSDSAVVPIPVKSFGDGTESEMSASPTSRFIGNPLNHLSLPEVNMQTSTTPTIMKEQSFSTGQDATKEVFPMDLSSNLRMGTSLVRSTNPLPRDSQFRM